MYKNLASGMEVDNILKRAGEEKRVELSQCDIT
jgi:hypothetical protein